MTVTFCGHREVSERETVALWLEKVVENLIAQGATQFMCGGQGAFDAMAASAVAVAKVAHPQIKLWMVTPYMDAKVDSTKYDDIVYPPLESTPRRYAIVHRNRWMVNHAEVVVAYVQYGGGADTMLSYAKKKHCRIIQYPQL